MSHPPGARIVKDRTLGDLYFPHDDQVMAPYIAEKGYWEPEELAWLKRHSTPSSSCLNVGANVGYFACWMSLLAGRHGHVVAVEPNPDLHTLLSANLRAMPESNWELVPVAAGSESGSSKLFVNRRNYGDSRLFDPRLTEVGGGFGGAWF